MHNSGAFQGFGTKVLVDGLAVEEVTLVTLGKSVEISANWIPCSAGHQRVLRAIQNDERVSVDVVTPVAVAYRYDDRELSGCALITPTDAAKLTFKFSGKT